MQLIQGAGLAAACIAEGDPKAALACVAGGLAAPVVGVMEVVKNTVGMTLVAAQVIAGTTSLLGHDDSAQLLSTTKPVLRACQ